MKKQKNKETKEIIEKINWLSLKLNREINLMEACGTHTQVVSRCGIKKILPENIKLIAGPGCPVCVTPQEDIDAIVNLAMTGIPVASYGDVLRAPGYYGSLEQVRSQGARVFSAYSIQEALNLQKKYPELVFFAIGFETTAPMTAFAIKNGLTVFSSHKLFLPAMKALLKIGEIKIDGFICPGHVSTIIGSEPYRAMKVSQVITGFEPEDVLVAIYLLLKQILENRKEVENQYLRSVQKRGNLQALKLIFEVFEPRAANWRGLGVIPKSGLKIKNRYKKFDAQLKYKKIFDKIDFSYSKSLSRCCCGEIIRGLKKPMDCPLFKKFCSPEKPFGPCMVSIEGACNVEYRYGESVNS